MTDIRDDILLSIRLDKTRLKYPLGYVFLCGGRLPEATTFLDDDGIKQEVPFQSFRDVINRRCLELSPRFSQGLWLAEDFYDWLHHSNVGNLIEFELDLADLSSLIVLVLEGPGAFAELGSFSVLNRISPKLVVILNQNTIPSDGFVQLGPLRYIENNHKQNLLRGHWDANYHVEPGGSSVSLKLNSSEGSKKQYFDLADDFIKSIDYLFDKSGPKEVKFDFNNNGHVGLLMVELCHFFHGLKLRELILFLEYVGVIIEESKAKEVIYILKKFDLIYVKEYMSDDFYVPGINYEDRFRFQYESGAEDILEIKNKVYLRHKVKEYYEKYDEFRINALGLNQ